MHETRKEKKQTFNSNCVNGGNGDRLCKMDDRQQRKIPSASAIAQIIPLRIYDLADSCVHFVELCDCIWFDYQRNGVAAYIVTGSPNTLYMQCNGISLYAKV